MKRHLAVAWRLVHLLIFEYGFVSAVDCSSPGPVATSDDASALARDCPAVQGDVFISANAAGDIILDGITSIDGRLAIQSCGSSCQSNLTKISSSTIQSIGGGIEIENAKGLKEVSLTSLSEARGNISFWNLPALETLDLGALRSAQYFRVGAVSQLYYLGLAPAAFGAVNVSGNGNLVLGLSNNNVDGTSNNSVISSLDTSGIGGLQWSSGTGEGNNVGNLSVRESNLREVPLLFQTVRGLDIRNNSEVTEVLFPKRSDAQSLLVSQLRDITIAGNALLNLTTIHDVTWNDTAMTSWVWPSQNMDSVVLDGMIHGEFFHPLLAAHVNTNLDNQNQSKPRVLVNFQVSSSVPGFLCGPLDGLRRRGAFPGNYSCNGNSVDIPSGASRSTALEGSASVLVIVVGMMIGLIALT